MDFGLWNSATHEDGAQQKRITSAKKADTTPASVDRENKTATFKGSGKSPYTTTLHSCTCRDFLTRKLPCKHIYRLALELEGADIQEGVNKNDFIDHIFAFPPSVQEVLYRLINDFKDVEHVSTVCVRNENHNALLQAGLINKTIINIDYLFALDINTLKWFMSPFDICADVVGARVKNKRQYLCDWISKNERAIVPLIQKHFIVLEFIEQLDGLKKQLYARFRKKFIRVTEPTEYWGGDVDENDRPIMEWDYFETRTVLREFFSQEGVNTEKPQEEKEDDGEWIRKLLEESSKSAADGNENED